MKRERKPPAKWRRNMVAAAAFLALLDGVIISATPSMTRIAFAAAVTILVGIIIARIWRSNVKIEQAETGVAKGKPSGRR